MSVVPIFTLGVVRCIGGNWNKGRVIRAIKIGLLVFVIMFAGKLAVNSALTTYRTSPWVQLPVFDISGIIHGIHDPEEQKSLYEQIPAHMREGGSLENVLIDYSPRNWGTLVQKEHPAYKPEQSTPDELVLKDSDLTSDEKNRLMLSWGKAILSHPVAWLTHRANVFRQVIGLTHDSVNGPVFMEPNGYADWIEKAYGSHNPEQNAFQLKVKWLMAHLSWHSLFRPWIYLVIDMVLVAVCFFHYSYARIQVGLIALSGVAHEAGLFFLAPACDFRYSHYMIYTSLLSLMLFLRLYVTNDRHASQAEVLPIA